MCISRLNFREKREIDRNSLMKRTTRKVKKRQHEKRKFSITLSINERRHGLFEKNG